MSALARAAREALVAEALLTPKPGLVDRDSRGAHRDLELAQLLASAHALETVFAAIADTARDARPSVELREALGAIGRAGERTMLRASGGTNTHRGALWALGLLVAAAAMRPQHDDVFGRAAALARIPDRYAPTAATHGRVVHERHGVDGARGEAAAAFPTLRAVTLPALRRSPAHALVATIAVLDDTCVLYRRGVAGLRALQADARAIVPLEGRAFLAGLERVRRRANADGVSPGGAADLLAAALFVSGLAPPS